MDEDRQNQPEGERTPPPPPIPAAVAAMEPGPPPKTSGLAIASLVLAILAVFTCVTAPIGLALGIIAMVQIGRNPQALRGMGLAVAGTIVSGIAVLMLPILAAILFPVFARARDASRQTVCLSNVKQLSTAVHMYMADNDDRFPLAENWTDALQPYVKRPQIWTCPSEKSKQPSYAMNGRLDGMRQRDVAMVAQTVMLFESVPGKNQAGGPELELLPSPPRHLRCHNVGFVDGHVRGVEESSISSLNWDPLATAPPTTPELGAVSESEKAPSG